MIVRKISIQNELINSGYYSPTRANKWMVEIANALTECPHVQIITMPALSTSSNTILEFKIGNSNIIRITMGDGDLLRRNLLNPTTMNNVTDEIRNVYGGSSTSASLYLIWNDNFFTFFQNVHRSLQQMYAIKLSDGNWYISQNATTQIYRSDIQYYIVGTAIVGLTVSGKVPLIFPRFGVAPSNRLTDLTTMGEITLANNSYGWTNNTILKDENGNFCLYFTNNVLFR